MSCLLVVHTQGAHLFVLQRAQCFDSFRFSLHGAMYQSLSENPVVLSFFRGGTQGGERGLVEGQGPASLGSAGLVYGKASVVNCVGALTNQPNWTK